MKRVWQDRAIFVDDTAAEDTIVIEDASGVRYDVLPTLEHFPRGAQGLARHMGVAADASALDFSVVHLARPNTAAAVYTRNLCVSPAVTFDRENTNRGLIQLVCVISKNARTARCQSSFALPDGAHRHLPPAMSKNVPVT